MSDGIELHSAEHPRGGFWLWLRNMFRRIRGVETVEIELPDGNDYECSQFKGRIVEGALVRIDRAEMRRVLGTAYGTRGQ